MKDADTIAAYARCWPTRRTRPSRSWAPCRSGREHRRARPHRARVSVRSRCVSVDPRLPRLPEVALHLAERGHLPRHPRLNRGGRRRHPEHRHHRVHRRRSRRHQRDLLRRRGRRRVAQPRGAHPGGSRPGHSGGCAGPPVQCHRAGDRELREEIWLRRRPRFHRARHRHAVPLRSDRPALRRARVRPRRSRRA